MAEYEGIEPLRAAVAGSSADFGAGGVYVSSETAEVATTIPYYHVIMPYIFSFTAFRDRIDYVNYN
jgi:hypothetical protein